MSDEFVLNGERREDVGKGASRRLRRLGKVPAVMYGAEREPVSLTFNHHEVIHELENEAFYSSILNIKVDGRSQKAILRDLQRHPYKPGVLHLDLMRVRDDVAITINVPLHFLNEESCPGVKNENGILSRNLNDIEVSCLPKDLPEYIEIDVGQMSIGDALHVSDLVLPDGVELVQHPASEGEEVPDVTIVTVQPPQVQAEAEADADGADAVADDDGDGAAGADDDAGRGDA